MRVTAFPSRGSRGGDAVCVLHNVGGVLSGVHMPFENIVPVVVIGFGFPIFFVGLFVSVIFVTASRSGWTLLAKYYVFQPPFTGKKWHMQSAHMGFSHYRGCLTVGSSNEGLYLSTSFLFSFGHSPLFIPWSDITIAEQQEWHGLYVDLTFPKAP
ncbi:MAG: hypothetical protein GFH27_549309n44 [Chloroflexi bacterium AL-W]|nr:hypothetical protein [Chloroflexi bacterium AL-N1]NOK69747.1 hypothetical protein [Chloroflexi bacterium AL-N10]NOK73649.1 hypothetical protein [Chloroflexi bacterium AL-N5]NOK83917.1 hypothetical protein [Chloroflexi bacterium AL-W]NOK87980.1 hypothetical protein [Chloroflexi bacterium AL-N15]